MEKQIFLCSVIAVVILILVSFTGVVGYQTTKSSTIARASPLFKVRTSRAIGEESKDIACDYVGKGEETNIYLSSRIQRTEQTQKVINFICKMDDKAFSKFVERVILRLKNQERMTSKEISDMLQALQYIRRNPNDMENYDMKNNPRDNTLEYITCLGSPCLIQLIALIFMMILISIVDKISSHFTCFHYPHVC